REEKQKTEKERKNTKKRKIPTSVHFLLQSKKSRNRKNPKEKESRSSSIHTTAAEITEQERRDHQAQALTNSLILPKFTKAKRLDVEVDPKVVKNSSTTSILVFAMSLNDVLVF
ncbi:hypothetical protein LINPERHAP2_LOCUS42221, partial [Linum perenne]